MKMKMDTKFWGSLNIVAKVLMIIGVFCVDLAFKLSGMEQKKG